MCVFWLCLGLGGSCSIDAGQSVLLPHGLAVECKCEGAYTVVSLPAPCLQWREASGYAAMGVVASYKLNWKDLSVLDA